MNEYGEISAILSSLYYNRETDYMVEITREILRRAEDTYPCSEWSDMGNLIYGMIVIRYGDYGTSPRSGWLDEEHKENIINELKAELLEYQEILAREIEEEKGEL